MEDKQDKRFGRPNAEEITRLRTKKLWTIRQLAIKAGVSPATVKRSENKKTKRMQLERLLNIATALEARAQDVQLDFTSPIPPIKSTASSDRKYSWDELVSGAARVAQEICKDGKVFFDAVLTFPGPSSIFCGLVLATLPLKTFINLPVYTIQFVDANAPVPQGRSQYFQKIKVGTFNVLVPKEVFEKPMRIIVIDDTILTGGTMKEMRKYFKARYGDWVVEFACCICYEGRTLLTEQPPEIIGLPLEQRLRFPMPWDSHSFCFEDAYESIEPVGKHAAAKGNAK